MPIEHSELNRLRDVNRFNRVGAGQVGDRPRHAQDPHVRDGSASSEPAKDRARDEVEDDREDEDPAEPDAQREQRSRGGADH
jgi:chromosome condensin MukBEF MukE localization factor